MNVQGFSPEQAEFNTPAPDLMTSVNMDSKKARQTGKAVFNLMGEGGIVCGGHGESSDIVNKMMTGIFSEFYSQYILQRQIHQLIQSPAIIYL